jgi:hypothetical protein
MELGVNFPPFDWAEFWNIALWGPLTQETVSFLKKASGDRSQAPAMGAGGGLGPDRQGDVVGLVSRIGGDPKASSVKGAACSHVATCRGRVAKPTSSYGLFIRWRERVRFLAQAVIRLRPMPNQICCAPDDKGSRRTLEIGHRATVGPGHPPWATFRSEALGLPRSDGQG